MNPILSNIEDAMTAITDAQCNALDANDIKIYNELIVVYRQLEDAWTRVRDIQHRADGTRDSRYRLDPDTLVVIDDRKDIGDTTMKLRGHEAITYAEAHGLLLSKYADPVEDARQHLTPEEARKIAREDPRLIYLEIE